MSSLHVISNKIPVCQLACKTAFDGLTLREKRYAHFISRASFEGGLIVLLQTSSESAPVFLLLQQIFTAESVESLRGRKPISDDEFQSFLVYASAVFTNMGNYKSFGDSKMIPGLSKESFRALVESSVAYTQCRETIDSLWAACADPMYSLESRDRELAFPPKGKTSYYSVNCTQDDAEFIQGFLTEKGISPYNTRLFKSEKGEYEIRIASVAKTASPFGSNDKMASRVGDDEYKGKRVRITRGDYSELLERVAENLRKASECAANENEKSMLEYYVRSFETGSIDDHKDGSRYWIKDKGPIIETYIGFIESYRDPFGVRGEFEGFVAMVNKEMSRKFENLVASAEKFLPLLPWPRAYEKDVFLKPDFTSLDVLSFGGSGIPAGINIPNYNDIRGNEGFKNVSLGNVLAARADDKRVSFLEDDDAKLYVELKSSAFEVQVGLHELMGHGSGKHFQKKENGELNFDVDTVRHTETNEKITSFYGPHDTWDSKFTVVASSYEECRAECVGIYMCLSEEILKIFGYEGQAADDIIYVNWLLMVRAGVVGLEFFSPETKIWRQAHMQARYVILQVLLEAGEGLVDVRVGEDEEGKPDIVIRLDRSKIGTVGKKAVGDFLRKLQVYKSTADVESGTSMYNRYSSVNEHWLKCREIVLAKKQPRPMFVQANTKLQSSGEVELLEYSASVEGIVESFAQRFPRYDSALESLWKNR
ncbi:dipeptidyl peptidase 3-like [Oscarella lobularis]|uniref:dipeptidyl peptidase 3-like n=1 Tax=Oscarella lobularis TaxID=121494 RepID=UPI00331397C2